jgi:hypothetical protein
MRHFPLFSLLAALAWSAPTQAAIYFIPVGSTDPNEMVGGRLEVGYGIVASSNPPVEAETGTERFLAMDAWESTRKTFTFIIGVPLIESGVIHAKKQGGGSPAEGVAFRDGLVLGVGIRSSVLFGYEMMLGYRAAGLGLLFGAMGQYAEMGTRGAEFAWRLRYQGRLEIPCPWARIPFQLNPHWDRNRDGSYGVQAVVPLNWSFSLYATVQHVTAVSTDVQNGTPVSATAEGRQILFGLNADMPEHFHVRRPRTP